MRMYSVVIFISARYIPDVEFTYVADNRVK